MTVCAHCLSQINGTCRFCPVCGQATNLAAQPEYLPPARTAAAHPLADHPAAGPGGLGQVFGLDPRVVFLTLVVDAMLFGGDVISGGAGLWLSIPAAVVLGLITYKSQRHWYRDDRDSAIIKGLVVGLLTAIPTSLPGLLTLPSGIMGLVHLFRRKKADAAFPVNRPAGS